VEEFHSQWMHLRSLVCNTLHPLLSLTKVHSLENNLLRWRDKYWTYAWKTSTTMIFQSWISQWENWLSLSTVKRLMLIRINWLWWVLLKALLASSNSSELLNHQQRLLQDWAQLDSILALSSTMTSEGQHKRMNSFRSLKWRWWTKTILDYQEGVKETRA